jgi:hypothetical protein
VGEREKKADSAADTIATIINNTNMESIANKILRENGFITMPNNGDAHQRRILLVKFKIKDFN